MVSGCHGGIALMGRALILFVLAAGWGFVATAGQMKSASVGPIEADDVSGEGVTVQIVAGQPGRMLDAAVRVVNHDAEPVTVDLAYLFQQDSALYSVPLPDPVFGSNHALGLKSWIVADGQKTENDSLTDGRSWTSAGTAYKRDYFTEAFQFVELDKVRRITKMAWLSGDANHTWFVDVAASVDGQTFAPVQGLQNVDQYKKWGWRDYPLISPFEAKVIRFRYHTGDSQTKVNAIRFPSELGLYDGIADETVALPRVGPILAHGHVATTVPARSFRTLDLPAKVELKTGACLVGVDATWPGGRTLVCKHSFAGFETDRSLVSPDSRFGLNVARMELAPKLRNLGIGWVRFENMKWPFVSPEPHEYHFDGSTAPWHVNTDDILGAYDGNGLNVLNYMFLTPKWISSAPAGTKENRITSFPPKDLSLYGEFCFQVAARYGNAKHSPEVLLSNDKKSGLGLVHHYEMWNEPDLNPKPDAGWGGWSASMDEYYEMMRYGAEAVKKADPMATVTTAGYASISPDTLNRLRTYRYPDGKCPLDFVDLINVHYYSGQVPPEIATEDGNAGRTTSTTFTQNLDELIAWRDRHAPEMPIWMTETGYDSAGPFGTTEAVQAARLPRVVMLCLAHGVDKVFVYRESGSTPSKHACSGLLRNDFTEKPSWFTFGTLVRQFKNVKGRAVRLPHPDENVWLLKWDDDGTPLLTAWTVPGEAKLDLDLGDCSITDAFGAKIEGKDTKDLEITPYPIYIRDMEGTPAWRKLLDAYEQEQRRLKNCRRQAVAAQKYLYDFGSTDHRGRVLLDGIQFAFTPVQSTDTWDATRGYGFNVPALRDEDRHWMDSKLDRDGCRMRDDIEFRFRVEPGSYRLSLGLSPFADSGTVTIGGVTQPIELPVTKQAGQAEVEFVVSAPTTLSVSHRGYAEIRWLSLIEAY